MADNQFGQPNIPEGQQSPPSTNIPGANPPISQTEPIPPVDNASAMPEPVAPVTSPDIGVPPSDSADAVSQSPAGGDYMDNVLGEKTPTEPAAPSENLPGEAEQVTSPTVPTMAEPQPEQPVPPAPEASTPDGGLPQFNQLPPEGPGAGGVEEPPFEEKKPNLWLPIVVLVIIVAAAAVYFIFFNKSSKTEQPTGTLVEESTTSSTTSATTSATSSAAVSDTTKKEDLVNIQKALEKYYLANQKYPVSTSITKTQDSETPLKILIPDYIEKLPTDTTGSYYGYKSEDGKTYELSAVFNAAPSDVKSTKIEKGYLVTLTPGLTFETSK